MMTSVSDHYNYFAYQPTDAADALTYLKEQREKGYEYVQGLPDFYVPRTGVSMGGSRAVPERPMAVVYVLFKRLTSTYQDSDRLDWLDVDQERVRAVHAGLKRYDKSGVDIRAVIDELRGV